MLIRSALNMCLALTTMCAPVSSSDQPRIVRPWSVILPRTSFYQNADNNTMWIIKLPADYYEKMSFCYGNVFLWQSGKVFVMDNHMAALWCWLQTCDPNKKYNFMHIDRHYDMLECFYDEDLEPVRNNPHISFNEFIHLKRKDGKCVVFRWDNYIRAGQVLFPEWFHTNIFLTQGEGDIGKTWGHKPMIIRKENPLFIEWYIKQYIEDPDKCLDGFEGNDYKLPWIVNLDLDVFYTIDSHIQLFSDEYIKRVAEILQNNLNNIAALTIAISPDCLGGEDMKEKWNNGFRILKIMSEKLECLKALESEVGTTSSQT